jgi:hypothetical protein
MQKQNRKKLIPVIGRFDLVFTENFRYAVTGKIY